MSDQPNVNIASLDDVDVCYVRGRRIWPWGSRTIYEAVGTRGGKLEVLAATRKVPRESDAAGAAVMQIDQMLQRDGWRPMGEPHTMDQYFVTCYTRPVPQKAA
jgi:hypothetical protein